MKDTTTLYRYDGQMGIGETYYYATANNPYAVDIAQNIVGPRGIEAQITRVNGGTPNTKYPVYDGHGNMISQVSINQSYNAVSGTWSNSGMSLGNNRKYDAWRKLGRVSQQPLLRQPQFSSCATVLIFH
ncbi:MAG: hypothetical protein J0L72_07755 [Armatimonadetes bacterium]|nr:hypothetical protein [Armatimonadota bacterium]